MKFSKPSILINGIAILLMLSIAVSCKKSTVPPATTGLSQDIQNIVPAWLVDTLRADGMAINEGQQPPVINGIYLFSPNICTFDNSVNSSAGNTFEDYKYWFFGQDNNSLTINVKDKNVSGAQADSSSGSGAFLSGNDSLFSAFIETTGISNNIADTVLNIYSGQVTPAGIVNFQQALYVKGKGPDPYGALVAVGTTRIFEVGGTGGGTAITQSTY